MPNEVVLYVLPLMFHEHSFLDPSHGFPALELDQDLIGIDGFHEVEEDVALDGVAREVEGFVDLDERVGHKDIMELR